MSDQVQPLADRSNTVEVELSRAAATFLLGTVRHLNTLKALPSNTDEEDQALQTSAWLEEIEARFAVALDDVQQERSA